MQTRSPEGAQRIPGAALAHLDFLRCAYGMVHYRRNRVAGGTYFFTVNLRDRRLSLLVEHADALRRIVMEVRGALPFVVDAMVVLPDHFHAVWTMPPDDHAYARRIQLLEARFTRHLVRQGVATGRDSRGEYALWQPRFWEHTIRDKRDFETHLNYVHVNPVKHGYVARAVDWPHSTVHRYVERGILATDWACTPIEGTFGEG